MYVSITIFLYSSYYCVFLHKNTFLLYFLPASVSPCHADYWVVVFQPITAATGTIVSVSVLCQFTTTVFPNFSSVLASPPAPLPLRISHPLFTTQPLVFT